MKFKAGILIVLFLLSAAAAGIQAATDEGYGEDSTALGQFVDTFNDLKNVSVIQDVVRNATLNAMELNFTSTPASWIAGYGYRKTHNITGTTVGVQTNYTVTIKGYYGAGIDGTETNGTDTWGKVYFDSKCQVDFDDVNFTKSDGVTSLDYWVAEKVDSSYAIFWVEIEEIPISPNNVTIYVYYGNDAVSSASNGDDTFPVFIDMEDGTLNEWSSTYGTATKTASGEHSHTGSFDAKLLPAVGVPGPSGLLKDISAYDEGYAYRVWFYDVPTKINAYATSHRIEDIAGNSIYLTGQGNLNFYQYWDGAGYINTAVARTAGFHYFEYRVNSTFTYLIVDGINVRTSTRLNEGILKEINDFVYRANPNPSWFDDMIVRKWVTPEPTHGSWGDEQQAGGYAVSGYFTTVDYLSDPLANGSVLVAIINTSIPANTQILVEFSEDNSTWVFNDWDPLVGGFESVDLRDLNYSSGYHTRFNLSSSDSSETPRVYQNRVITTLGNDSIRTEYQNITGEWIYYNLTAILNITGTHDEGALNSTYWIDGDTWNCSEVVGVPGYEVRFNITGIDPAAISLWLVNYVFYDGSASHEVNVELWNFTSSAYVEIGEIPDQLAFEWMNFTIYPLRIPLDFVNSSGVMVGRFYHEDAGNINHDVVFDRISLHAFIPTEAEASEAFQFFWIVIGIALMLIGIVLSKMWFDGRDP